MSASPEENLMQILDDLHVSAGNQEGIFQLVTAFENVCYYEGLGATNETYGRAKPEQTSDQARRAIFRCVAEGGVALNENIPLAADLRSCLVEIGQAAENRGKQKAKHDAERTPSAPRM